MVHLSEMEVEDMEIFGIFRRGEDWNRSGDLREMMVAFWTGLESIWRSQSVLKYLQV